MPPNHRNLYYEITKFAEEVRQAADVASRGRPVPKVIRAAERLGCLVLPMHNELGQHPWHVTFLDGIPLIRVSRPPADGDIPGDLQRFAQPMNSAT